MTQFDALGLAAPLLKSIETQGFTAATPIQAMSIPPLMEGHDLMGIAHTGGGKTAAFSLPLIHKLLENPSKPLPNTAKALILAPTRELAQQIGQCVVEFSRGSKLTHLVIAGGLPYGPQIQKLKRGVDILIATPGRLMDHVGRGGITFDETHTYILDEADRMLDMGFINDVMDISKSLPKDHQTVLFSATMNPKIRKLSQALLNDPVYVEIEQKTTVAETIDHKVMNVKGSNKRDLLIQTLDDGAVQRVLVFTRTKRGADKLTDFLIKNNIDADAIHGDKRQRVREKILRNFRNGRIRVLVATDLAARGIDVDDVTHVVNYELPIEPENYVHRVGRTGRAGKSGIAISFCDPEDVGTLRAIERLIKLPIVVDEDHEYHIEVPKTGPAAGKKKPQRGGHRGRNGNGGGNRNRGGFGKSSNRSDKRSSWSPTGDQKSDEGSKKRSYGKRSDGGRAEGGRSEGGRSEGKRFEGSRSEGGRSEGKRFEGKRDGRSNDRQAQGKSSEGGKFAQKKRSSAKGNSKPNGVKSAEGKRDGNKGDSNKFGGQQKRRVRSKHAA